MKKIYVLLADDSGTVHSVPRSFGVAVETKEEAELFMKENQNFGYDRDYKELVVFPTKDEAIEFWKKL